MLLERFSLEDGREMVMPGDNVTIECKIDQPIAMDKGLRFAIREGGRTVVSARIKLFRNSSLKIVI